MGWARFDDEYLHHPKIQAIPGELRAYAIALEVAAITYSTRLLTDGFVPEDVVKGIAVEAGIRPRKGPKGDKLGLVLGHLLAVKRWSKEPNGYRIHDFLEYQPSAEEVKERRRKEAEKKRNQRAQGRMSLGLSPGDTRRDSVLVSPGLSPGDASRARASGAGARPRPAPTHTPEEQEQKSSSLSADGSETTVEGLPVEKQRITVKLIAEAGPDADETTAIIIRRYAERLSEGALAKVLESVRSSKARNRAAYIVGSLRDEVIEISERTRATTKPRSELLREDPEAFVRKYGVDLETSQLESLLADFDELERERLLDLAADERSARAASRAGAPEEKRAGEAGP